MSETVRVGPEVSLVRLRQELARSDFLITELPPLVYDVANIIDAVEDRIFIASPHRYFLGLPFFDIRHAFQSLATLGAIEQNPIEYGNQGFNIGLLRYRQTIGRQIENPGLPITLNLTDGDSKHLKRNPVFGRKKYIRNVTRIMNVLVFPNTAVANLAIEFRALQAAGIQLHTVNILDPKEVDMLDPSIRAQINTLSSLSLFVNYAAIRDIFVGIEKANGINQTHDLTVGVFE